MQAATPHDPLTLELGHTFAEVSGNLLMTRLEIMTSPYALIDWDCPADLMIDDRNAKVIALGIGELATNSMK